MLSKDQFVEALHKAVELRGEDYVDPHVMSGGFMCLYVTDRESDPQPGCLVGTAVYLATGEFISEEYEGTDPTDLVDYLSPEAIEVAVRVQVLQDVGETWGTAVQAA